MDHAAVKATLENWADQTTIEVPLASVVLGIGRSAAYEAVRRGEIPHLRFGRRVVVPVAALKALLAAATRD